MDSIPQREDLLMLPMWALAILCVLAFAAWAVSWKFRDRFPVKAMGFVAGTAFLFAALLLLFNLLAQFLTLSTSWPLPVIAVMGALAGEILIGLYRLERSIVTRWRGRLLLGLRLTALAILLAILIEPVSTFLREREIPREVAVLIDESASMRLSDQRLTIPEQLDRAEMMQVGAVEKRPTVDKISDSLEDYRRDLRNEIAALDTAPDSALALETRKDPLGKFLSGSDERTTEVGSQLLSILEALPNLQENKKNQLRDFQKTITEAIPKFITESQAQVQAGAIDPLHSRLDSIATQLDQIIATLPSVAENADAVFFAGLEQKDREAIEAAAKTNRLDLATGLLEAKNPEGVSFYEELAEHYNLRFYRFDDDISEVTPVEGENKTAFGKLTETSETTSAITDLTTAFEHVLENTSADSLAGVLLLSDGRHNGAIPPEDTLRQLAGQGSRLNAVTIGSELGPIDASLLSLNAPESIYLGDRVLVKSEIKLDGLRGKKVRAVLTSNGEQIDEQFIEVSDVSYRTELRFVHQPEEKGIFDYRLELEPLEDELFDTNNAWDFKVAITDDRTNVLLVDSVPRWEFRYLRNLFYGRDKSVHLQYVLLNPDTISGAPDAPRVPASASRKFGDAEATVLPENKEEWGLFDVIILGDLPPGAISKEEWETIEDSVARRGSLLVTIAGPRHMPHTYENEVLERLLPITWESNQENSDEILHGPEERYRIDLTATGRSHPVTTQSNSRTLNQQLWSQLPELRWRYAPTGVKENAEVLAWARTGAEASSSGVNPVNAEAVEAAIERLANQKQHEAEHALVTVHRVGLGKVAMLNFDRTWRFRYGVGDTYHHRFWGQLVRWGAGANLRSGNEKVRLGTDRLSYTPSDSVMITAKVLTDERRPVTDADVYASILDPNGAEVFRQKLSYRTASSGLYETNVTGLTEPGEYQIRLEGDEIDEDDPIETELLVVTTRNPVELAELTADYDFLTRATSQTGGKVVSLNESKQLLDAFGPPKETLTERDSVTLWDKWQLLVGFLGLLTTEWVLRRRSGLA